MPEHEDSPECRCWGCVSERQHDKRLAQLIECVEMVGFKLLPWQVEHLRWWARGWPVEHPNVEHIHWQSYTPAPDQLTRSPLKMWPTEEENNEPGN